MNFIKTENILQEICLHFFFLFLFFLWYILIPSFSFRFFLLIPFSSFDFSFLYFILLSFFLFLCHASFYISFFSCFVSIYHFLFGFHSKCCTRVWKIACHRKLVLVMTNICFQILCWSAVADFAKDSCWESKNYLWVYCCCVVVERSPLFVM